LPLDEVLAVDVAIVVEVGGEDGADAKDAGGVEVRRVPL
jgi:hypothetical protein